MNMKKIMAGAVASVMAVSTIAVAASALDLNNPFTVGDDKPFASGVELAAWGSQWMDCYNEEVLALDFSKYEVVIKATPDGDYDDDNNIALKIYQISGGAEDITVDGVAGMTTIEYAFDFDVIKLNDYGGINFMIQAGHLPITLTSVSLREKEGAPTTTEAATTTAPSTPTTGDTTTNENPKTGIEGVAIVAGLAIVATGAVVVSKKRK